MKIIPLGGLDEIGKNMTVYEYGGEIIVVDCGMAFPDEEMYGIDCVIPDVSYLVKHKNRIRGCRNLCHPADGLAPRHTCPPDARYCEQCGAPTAFLLGGLLKPYTEWAEKT